MQIVDPDCFERKCEKRGKQCVLWLFRNIIGKIFASDLRGSGILGFGSEALDRVVIGGKVQYLPEESFLIRQI